MSPSTVLAPRGAEELRGTALVVGLAGLLVVWSVVQTATTGIVQPHIAIAFGGFILIGEIVRINLPGDREAAPLGAAGALAYAMLATYAGTDTTYDIWQVVTLTAAAAILGALPHVAAGRSPRADEVARRVLTAALAAAAFRPLYDAGHGPLADRPSWVLALVMAGIVVLTGLLDASVAALVRADRNRAPYLSSLRDELRALLGLGSAIGATGVLIALAAQVMGWWAIPVFCVPLLLTQFSFRRYAAIRATYLQTIRSLSRVTEVGGYTESGHARRVSEISVAVGRELGLSEEELLELEYAALMHDLGQLSLTEPIPGGATVMVDPGEQRRIAEMGAEVIRETGVLDEVADIIERQADPYRRPREHADGSLPVASRIIKAANAYDDMVGDSAEYGPRLDALERLRLGMAYDFDPRVVETLARIVRKTHVTV